MGLKYRINGWVKGILNWRIADAITTWYVNISPAYSRSFWISFIIINVVFCVHTANFLFGNHDFSSLFGDIVWFRMAMEG
ncbi:MAG: hypothetical protein VB042_09625, partial [Victivallaceae bacterium]|nr:hypothetical protein [Victivallaceae bacterium]